MKLSYDLVVIVAKDDAKEGMMLSGYTWCVENTWYLKPDIDMAFFQTSSPYSNWK